jgi:HlyD family secretion protein
MKTLVALFVTATVVALGIARYWRDDLADLPSFRSLPVKEGDLYIGVTATGTVEPVQIIDVGAQIVGSIKSFGPDPDHPEKPVDYRSRVTKGAVLAQLDDLPHRAELDKARVNLQFAEADLRTHQAQEKQKKRAFVRAQRLRGRDSEADFEKIEAENDVAVAEVAMSEAKLEQAKIAKKQAEDNLRYTIISSPIDGVVIDRRVNIGQTVVAGMNAPSLFLLAKDLHEMLVWAAVNEADIGEIHQGQNVSFTVDAYPGRSFSGTVSQIRLNASLQQNVVTYGVIVDVDNKDGQLLPYMTAKLQFEVANHKNVRLVPNQALRWRPTWAQISPPARAGLEPPPAPIVSGGDTDVAESDESERRFTPKSPTVWVVAADGLVRPVPVKTGLSDGMYTEITGPGLEPGNNVVTSVAPKAERDFVSSFVAKVTQSKN